MRSACLEGCITRAAQRSCEERGRGAQAMPWGAADPQGLRNRAREICKNLRIRPGARLACNTLDQKTGRGKMTHIAVHKEPQGKPVRREHEWDPFRTMRDVLKWDPFGEVAPRWFGEELGFSAAFEVKESKDTFVFKADLPGLKIEDLDVKLTQNRLTISGKREAEKTEQGDTFYTFERSYGAFSRSFTLPEGVDSEMIEADLRDGVLTVTLPKKPEAQPKQINVKAK